MTRRRKLLFALAGGVVATFAALAAYLTVSDLAGWRDTVARIASNAMGRELTIAGEFTVDLGIVTRVHATGLSLANAGWGSEPGMATVDRLDGEINLWELLTGSVHLPSVEIEGARAIFEADADQGSNWRLGTGGGTGRRGPVRLRIDRIEGADIALVFRRPKGGLPLDVQVMSIASTGDTNGMQQLSLSGRLMDRELNLAGRVGPLSGLVNLDRVEHDLIVTLDDAEIRSRGTIGNLAALAGLEIEATAAVPDPDRLAGVFGLSTGYAGRIEAEVKASASGSLTRLDLHAKVGSADARITGTVDSLLNPADLDVEVAAAGPDVRTVAAIVGIDHLVERPFEITGHVRWHGFPLAVSGLEVRVGDSRLSADGRIGAPPRMLDTDLRFAGGGPDLTELAAMFGAPAQPDPFEVSGRIVRADGGLRIEGVNLAIGAAELTASGFLGDPPEYTGTDLTVDARGPNLGALNVIAGVQLPAAPFTVRGRLDGAGHAITLREVRATVGSNTVTADGRLTTAPGMVGTDLRITADGDDLSKVGAVLGVDRLPDSGFHVDGAMAVTTDGIRLRDVRGRFHDLDVSVDGTLRRRSAPMGSQLEVTVAGDDLSALAAVVGRTGWPVEAFRVSGGFELLDHAVSLRGVELGLGSAEATLAGRIGTRTRLDGTVLTFAAHGPSLAVANPIVAGLTLPEAEFDVAGSVTVVEDTILLDEVRLEVAGNRVTADGAVVMAPGLVGSSVDIQVGGTDLAGAGRLVAAASGRTWPELPPLEYAVSGSLAADADGVTFDPLAAFLGSAAATISGRLGRGPGMVGTDLELDIDGPDSSLIAAVTGITIPVAPFRVSGRVTSAGTGYGFDRVRLNLGGIHAELDGTLGLLPRLTGTDLDVHVEGPDLEFVRDLSGFDRLPSAPFSLTGHFDGDPNRFSTRGFEVNLGSSDLAGDMLVDLEGKPTLVGRLRSERVVWADLWRQADMSTPGGDKPTAAARPKRERVFSDTPFDPAVLSRIDADFEWDISELGFALDSYRNVGIAVQLDDGDLVVRRLQGVGSRGGVLRGAASLTPTEQGIRAHAEIDLDNGKLNLAGPDSDPDRRCPFDLAFSLNASGRSWHELAGSASGQLSMTVGAGDVASSVLNLITADIVVALLKALNPFHTEHDRSQLECAVIYAEATEGTVTLDPVAIQTNAVTILGDGKIDLDSEDLKIDWVTKPRKGLGVSASAVTNSYLRLGGTLANPALEVKPVEALATTGVAVVTAGLSVLAKGFFDRVTADKKVCEKAQKQVEKRRQQQR